MRRIGRRVQPASAAPITAIWTRQPGIARMRSAARMPPIPGMLMSITTMSSGSLAERTLSMAASLSACNTVLPPVLRNFAARISRWIGSSSTTRILTLRRS
jgi:hypothetical protein